MQTTLFDDPEPPKTCGHCVHRNAQGETQEWGACSPADQVRHRDAEPCSYWFGLGQLRSALYGKDG